MRNDETIKQCVMG